MLLLEEPARKHNQPCELSDEDMLIHYEITGSDDSFRELYNRHNTVLRKYLKSWFRGIGHDLDDILQLVWMEVHEKPHLFERGKSVRNWIRGIAHNRAMDHFRSEGSRKRWLPIESAEHGDHGQLEIIDEQQPDPAAADPDENWLVKLNVCLPLLDSDDQELVRLIYFDGLDYRQAGERLGVTKSAVHRRLSKVHDRLKAMLLNTPDPIETTHNPESEVINGSR